MKTGAALMDKRHGLVVGASRGIGLGLVKQWLRDPLFGRVYATCRQPQAAAELLDLAATWPDRLHCLPLDVTNEAQIAQAIGQIGQEFGRLHQVVNCVGILHEGALQPEKSLRQVNAGQLLRYFQVNSIGTVLLAKHLLPLLRHGEPSVFAAISAKVGSIGDNELGGWYGYRASKAALNMLIRNIAIEYGRTSPQTIVVALHPGTTDTELSRPFQKNVSAEKLFSVDRAASQLLEVLAHLQPHDSGQFFSWDGSRLPW